MKSILLLFLLSLSTFSQEIGEGIWRKYEWKVINESTNKIVEEFTHIAKEEIISIKKNSRNMSGIEIVIRVNRYKHDGTFLETFDYITTGVYSSIEGEGFMNRCRKALKHYEYANVQYKNQSRKICVNKKYEISYIDAPWAIYSSRSYFINEDRNITYSLNYKLLDHGY